MSMGRHIVFGCAATLALAGATPALANSDAMAAFADNCFRPTMTAERAEATLGLPGVRYDFYDLDPFTPVAPSPATGRAATPGTDRRCEIAFDGERVPKAIAIAGRGLQREGIFQEADVPETFEAIPGAALVAARRLNPQKIAVVQVGTRPGPNGTETYMNVERLRSPE